MLYIFVFYLCGIVDADSFFYKLDQNRNVLLFKINTPSKMEQRSSSSENFFCVAPSRLFVSLDRL